MAQQTGQKGQQYTAPSRRNVVQGAAWSVPVVAVGVAAPAMSASPTFKFETHGIISYQSGTTVSATCGNNTSAIYTIRAAPGTPSSDAPTRPTGFMWLHVRDPAPTFGSTTLYISLPQDAMTLTSNNAAWTNMTRTAKAPYTQGTTTYYEYSATMILAPALPTAAETLLTATNPDGTSNYIQYFNWNSGCVSPTGGLQPDGKLTYAGYGAQGQASFQDQGWPSASLFASPSTMYYGTMIRAT